MKNAKGDNVQFVIKNMLIIKSLWSHNKKFHPVKVVVIATPDVPLKKHNCIYCEKTFNDKSNKYKHQKICHVKKEEETV